MKFKRKFLVLLGIALIALFAVRMAGATDKAATDTGYLGNDQWIVQTDGDLQPATDSSQDIGESGSEVNEIFTDYLTLGGTQKSSWGSVVSPWTDYSGYTALTDGSLDTIMYDDGDITLGGGAATDVQIIWNSDSNDYYIGVDDTENELHIGYGSDVTATEQISIPSTAHVYLGEDTDVDFGLVFQSGDVDYYMGVDYTGGEEEDLLCIGETTTVGASPALAIGKAAGMVYMDSINSIGSADFDIGDGGTTDVLVTTDGGAITLDGLITLPNGEIVNNTADDVVEIASDDAAVDLTLNVYAGFNAKDAILKLSSDISTDSGDDWQVKNDDSDSNNLLFQNDTSGAQLTVATLATTGIITTTNYVDQNINDSGTNAVIDVAKFTHTSSGTPAASFGVGLVFNLEDASGNGAEEMGSLDIVHGSTPTNGAEDADLIVSLESAGTAREILRIDGDVGVTGAHVLEFDSFTTETNGVVDILELTLDNTLDTATDNFGAGISILLEQEDSGTPVEHASIDVVLTDAGTAAEDSDIIFGQSIGGSAVATTVTFDADAGIDMSGTGYDLIFPGDELIDNDTANTLTVRSNDEATTLSIVGFTDKAAKLILDSDLGADNADTWTIEAEDGGTLTLDNHTTEILEISSAGALQIDSTLSVDGDAIDCDGAYLKILTASTAFHKYHYYPISYGTAATVARVGGGAEPLLCAGLAGVDELGSTQGYVSTNAAADNLAFRFALPETFIDTGTVTDLVLQFYIDEQVSSDAVTYDVNVYEFGSTTPIITDTLTVRDGVAAGWQDLDTNATGIGNDTDIDADDILIITLSPEASTPVLNAANIYGFRIKYATGIEATE